MHHSLDDELVVLGDVENGAAGAGVGQLDQRFVTQGVLQTRGRQKLKNLKRQSICGED